MRRAIGLPETERRTGFSRSTIYRLEREGRFPKRIRLSPGRVGHFEDEVSDWLEERAAEREAV